MNPGHPSASSEPAARSALPHAPVRVVIFGDIVDDIIVRPQTAVRQDTDTVAHIERRAGGSAANTAAWLGSLGTHVDFIGRTHVADTVRHETALRNSGVTAHLLGETALPTGTIVVIVEQDDTRTMLTEKGANVLTSPRDVTDALLTQANHLHFTGYTIFSGQPLGDFAALIERAHARGVTVSVDPGSAGFIADHGAEAFLTAVRGADILFPNLDEAVALAGAGAWGASPAEPLAEPTAAPATVEGQSAVVDALVEHFPLVALTLGRQGALVATSTGLRITIPCELVDAVDPTGAGDAFNAGFLAGYLARPTVAEIADAKVAAGDEATAGVVAIARLERAGALGVSTAAHAVQNVGARPTGVTPHHTSR